MEKKVEVKLVAQYNGHDCKQNGNIDLKLKCDYSELVNSIQMTQMLNNDICLMAKIPDEKAMKLGTFRLKEFKVSHDGESTLKFNSIVDFVETNNVSALMASDRFKLRCLADIEIEEV